MNFFKSNLFKLFFIFTLFVTQISFGSIATAETIEPETTEEVTIEPETTEEVTIEPETTEEVTIEPEATEETNELEETEEVTIIEYIPTVTTDDESKPINSLRAPNGVPITLTPSHNGLKVYVGNIGLDPLDAVTVKVTATGYSEQVQSATSITQLGHTFNFDISMIKVKMDYKVTVVIVDGGKTKTLNKNTVLKFSESELAEWSSGTYKTRAESVDYHFGLHGRAVGARTVQEYLQKANAMHQRTYGIKATNNTFTVIDTPKSGKKVAQRKFIDKSTGSYIIVTQTKKTQILSFG